MCSVGTRHVKVWRIEDNPQTSPSKQRFTMDGLPFTPPPITVTRTLPGRNCILGSLVDSVFSCVASISNGKALICSDRGDICLLEDNDGQNQLIRVTHAGFGVTCIAVDREHQVIQIGGKAGMTKTMSFDDLLRPTTPPASPAELDFSNSEGQTSVGNLCAMAIIDGRVVAVDSCHAITISETSDSTNFESSPISLTAHRDAVLGVRLISQPNKMAADFFSWDSMGKVLFWDLEGQSKGSLQIELEQCPLNEDEAPNQCLIVRSSVGATFFASGDKYGVLRIIDSSTQNQPFVTKAHNSDIEDIAIYEGKETTYIATAGRDRTVQLFQKVLDSWMLLQTMDEHAGSVGTICFSDDGDKIISSSADRTIQIRQIVSREVNGQNIVAAIPIRVIALKATPVSMVLSTHVPSNSVVVVSLMDRSVCTYEISTGKQTSSFRATDIEGNDAVVMDSLVMGKQGRPTLLAGVSGTDKSVRIYDWRLGMFLDRGFGHTASVTDVALLETPEQTTLISTGSDSTIMIWDLNKSTPELALSADISSDMSNGSPPKEITSAMPPLRRVLSKAELAEFQRPSPSSTPTGRGSPPRVLRRKTSKYSMVAQSSKPPIPPILSMPAYASTSDENGPRRGSPRNRSRSPPPSPKQRSLRRPSLADLRGRTKSTGHTSEFGSLNIATEQTCRTLRAYRKKLSSNEVIREDALKELDQELRLTAQSVLEKTLKTKAISETVLAGLLDQYSERLVSIFDEKLRLSLKPPGSVDTIPEIGIVNPKIRSKSSSRVSTSSSRRTSSN
jgi:WD40 repeat protein